jgi:hypothetical protein
LIIAALFINDGDDFLQLSYPVIIMKMGMCAADAEALC